jgi:hypothetical protein
MSSSITRCDVGKIKSGGVRVFIFDELIRLKLS